MATVARPKALLVHGAGAGQTWWNPLLPVVTEAGLHPVPLSLPLTTADPDQWCATVTSQIQDDSVVLISHSLGAAVCIEAALAKRVAKLVLLACPPFLPDFTPIPPPEAALPGASRKKAADFLRAACDKAGQLTCPVIHFVGDRDRWAPVEQARRLPLPLVTVPDAGHSLNRSKLFAELLKIHLKQPLSEIINKNKC